MVLNRYLWHLELGNNRSYYIISSLATNRQSSVWNKCSLTKNKCSTPRIYVLVAGKWQRVRKKLAKTTEESDVQVRLKRSLTSVNVFVDLSQRTF